MPVNVTPEVASAHKILKELCEKFETSVDEFCASPFQSIRTQDFYESKCVPIAVECVNALFKFQTVYSYEITAYENAVAEADNAMRQEKNELAQRSKACKRAVAKSYKTFHRQKRALEKDAERKIRDIEHQIQQVGVNITPSERRIAAKRPSKISYNKALELAKGAGKLSYDYFTKTKDIAVSSAVIGFLVGGPISCTVVFNRDYEKAKKSWGTEWSDFFEALLFGLKPFLFSAIIPPIIITAVAVMYYLWKKNKIAKTKRTLKFAAAKELYVISEEVEQAIAEAKTARDEKVKSARLKRDREKKADAEARKEEIMLASHDRKIEVARSRKDQAMAYIKKEYQVFDPRLCQGLDKLQLFLDTWATENTVDVLDEVQIQSLNQNDEQIAPHLTRIGNVKVWELIEPENVDEP